MPDAEARGLADHVIIGGYGRVGQTIGRLLAAENVPFIALDTNGELVSEGQGRGDNVYLGDAGRREFLHRVGAAQARAFVVTVEFGACRRAHGRRRRAGERPDAPVFARARDPRHAARLIKLGAIGGHPGGGRGEPAAWRARARRARHSRRSGGAAARRDAPAGTGPAQGGEEAGAAERGA